MYIFKKETFFKQIIFDDDVAQPKIVMGHNRLQSVKSLDKFL